MLISRATGNGMPRGKEGGGGEKKVWREEKKKREEKCRPFGAHLPLAYLPRS